jgi:hypothetical protein
MPVEGETMATAKTTTLTFPSNRAGRKHCAWLRTANTADFIIEWKKPKRSDGLEQLKSYCQATARPSSYGATAAKPSSCTARPN